MSKRAPAKMNFKVRLLLLASVWFVISLFVMASIYQYQQKRVELKTKQMLHKDLALHMRDDNPLMIGTEYNPKALKSIFHTLMLIGPDFEIYFLDASGNVRSHAAPAEAGIAEKVSLGPISHFLQGGEFPILGDDPKDLGTDAVFSVAPILEFGSTVGYLYVVIGSSQHKALLNSQTHNAVFWGGVFGFFTVFVFSILAYYLVKKSLLVPIETMSKDIENQVDNDFLSKVKIEGSMPELEPIAYQYDLVVNRIRQQFLQLDFQSRAQKAQLVQLSHDLKTPLSCILGYLETWLMTNQDPMISVAYKNAQKLSEQLQEQLCLAKNDEFILQPLQQETIELGSLISEVRETFAIQSKKKDIHIMVAVDEGASVLGNRSMIRRLFENLFENAVRHSPDHEIITLKVTQASEQKRVSVVLCNNVSQDNVEGSLGIGLKIARSILMLHQSSLTTCIDSGIYKQSFVLSS